jgi:hypothetical protein
MAMVKSTLMRGERTILQGAWAGAAGRARRNHVARTPQPGARILAHASVQTAPCFQG